MDKIRLLLLGRLCLFFPKIFLEPSDNCENQSPQGNQTAQYHSSARPELPEIKSLTNTTSPSSAVEGPAESQLVCQDQSIKSSASKRSDPLQHASGLRSVRRAAAARRWPSAARHVAWLGRGPRRWSPGSFPTIGPNKSSSPALRLGGALTTPRSGSPCQALVFAISHLTEPSFSGLPSPSPFGGLDSASTVVLLYAGGASLRSGPLQDKAILLSSKGLTLEEPALQAAQLHQE